MGKNILWCNNLILFKKRFIKNEESMAFMAMFGSINFEGKSKEIK